MSRKILIITTAVITGILVCVGLLFYLFSSMPSEIRMRDKINWLWLAFVKRKVSTIKIEDCYSFKGESVKDLCIVGVAVDHKSEALCEAIKTSSLAAYYYPICLKVVAEAKNDFELCRKIKENSVRDDCLSNIAWNTKNKELCNEISDFYRRDDCLNALDRYPE
jgi:hypothetical protein